MLTSEYRKGVHWAYRKGRKLGTPAARVELLALVERGRSKWVKVRHTSGELEGLEEFVRPTTLVCKWADWKATLRDEERELGLADYARRHALDPVVREAAEEILVATGEDMWLSGEGYTAVDEDSAARVADRAGVERPDWGTPPAFTSRRGERYVPNGLLVDLAIAFARAEPDSVGLHLEALEERYRGEGFIPGQRYKHETLLRSKPAWAVARQWAVGQPEREILREENTRLRGLLGQAISRLERVGEDREAKRLNRALRGR